MSFVQEYGEEGIYSKDNVLDWMEEDDDTLESRDAGFMMGYLSA